MINRLADFWASKGPKRSKLWRWFTYLLTVAMVVYLVYAFTQGNFRLDQIDWPAYGIAVLAALGIYLLSVIIQFCVWVRLISFHRTISWQDVNIYARTIMMRSLPGGAWHWVGRISMYSSDTEVPTKVVVVGNFLEWGLLILSGAGIFFITLPLHGIGFLLAAISFGIALWLSIAWQPGTRKWVIRIAEAGLWISLYCVAWFLAALILYLFVQAVAGLGKLGGLEALHVWSLTGSLGMLITMLPSSLGVREITLVWMLQPRISPSIALLIALMLRIIYTLADVVWGMAGWFVSYLVLRRHPPSPSIKIRL